MANPAIAFAVYFVEMMVAYLFLTSISEVKYSKLVTFAAGFLILEFGACISQFFENGLISNCLVLIGIHVLYILTCFQMKLTGALFYSLILFAICAATEILPIQIMSALTGGIPDGQKSNLMIFAFDAVISKLLYFMTCLFLAKAISWRKNLGNLVKLPVSALLYPVVTGITLATFHYVCMNEDISVMGQYILSAVSVALFLITIVLVFISQDQAEKEQEYLHVRSELLRVQQEKNYYDNLDEQNQQLMMFAHDAKNHIAAIQNLSQDPQLRGYVDALSGQLEKYSRKCHSGNRMLDVMINRYVMECERRGIQFEYNVKLYNLYDLADMDLVTILGNLLDNAIEAAEKTQEKVVYLETTTRNAYRVMVIGNSSLPPKENRGRLQSSKEDKGFHGYGLKSVARCLKKYHGDLQWDYNKAKNRFTMTVMMEAKIGK